ncbi:hypothetical protein HQ585_17815 [candidate division KSB1 bacterium]|nr:hypothetical protein [candidate division KSB1 bacterium]
MPDLITHVAISHLIKRPWDRAHPGTHANAFCILFYFGTILPDITSRALNIAFPSTLKWTLALHTPAGTLLCCIILTLLFESSIRKRAFLNLMGGASLHYLLDTFQYATTPVFFWGFPFSWADSSLHILDAGDIVLFSPVWVFFVVLMEIIFYLFHYKQPAHLH